MKFTLLILLATLITGCTSMPASFKSGFDGRDYWPDQIQKNANANNYGQVYSERAGGSVPMYSNSPRGTFTPSTIQTNSGPVLIVPNYSTGAIQAIITPGR
jgi:hypothetical protein